MNVLFTGRGTGGSWAIRGDQLGGKIGRAKGKATLDDMREADLIVLVKRPAPGMIDNISKSGKPWVWDVVDFYPQPACTDWSKDKAIEWVRNQIKAFATLAVIWPNQRMADDCGAGAGDLVLYHHHRIGMARNPVLDAVRVVGYEGGKVLGKWEKALASLCRERGWKLAVNAGTHADWDVCVAFRDTPFNGYVQRHWKSNVKLSNCHGSGTPFIGSKESGYTETEAGGEVWCDNIDGLSEAFDAVEPWQYRSMVSESFLASAITLDDSANALNRWLQRV